MPVKNVKRKTNDGFEGVITGLNDKEKEIIANSVGIEANPVDEATETLEKLKVDNITYNVGGGGGGATYTAGKNISISEANEISVVDDINDVKSIQLRAMYDKGSETYLKDKHLGLKVENKTQYCPAIEFLNNVYSYYDVKFGWKNMSWGNFNHVYFDFKYKPGGDFYPFMSRVSVPDVPTSDGTYVLKATISSGTLTYSWVKEGE